MTLLALTVFLAAAPDRKDLSPGLVASFAPAGVSQLDPTVAVTWGQGETPHPRVGAVGSVRWAGYLLVNTAGDYTFTGPVEGGTLTVRVNGADVVLDKPTKLPAGVLPFAAAFLPGGGAVRVSLHWQGPQFRAEPIPAFAFGHLPSERPATFAADAKFDRGRFLYEELACGKCHPVAGLVERTGPDLSEVGKRVYPGWLEKWLADPATLRPHTTMPAMFPDTAAGRAERYATAKYLSSLGGPVAEGKNPGFSNQFKNQVVKGETLFTTAGCAACHGKELAGTAKPSDDDDEVKVVKIDPLKSFYAVGAKTGAQSVYALGAVAGKFPANRLAEYLQDPLKTNPHGRMPRMNLTAEESRDLASHLSRQTDEDIPHALPKAPGDPPAGQSWEQFGKTVVTNKGCINCHALSVGGKPVTSTLKAPTADAISKKPTGGCLSDKPDPATRPTYSLDAADRAALTAFVAMKSSTIPAPGYAARVDLKRFACLNCHKRDGEGGIGGLLGDRMKALENAQNADDIQPPPLTGVGHKATPDWLKSVLLEGGRARPWMTLRMPQYGAANVGHLPAGLPTLDAASPSSAPMTDLTAAAIDAGRTLAGKNGLGCIGCHDISGYAGGGTRGPDLALTAKRVRFDWYGRWMHNPQRVTPGTRMPTNFNDGKSVLPKILGGDADKQSAALWAYFALGPGLPLPVGMEPPKGLIVAVGERPEILRTFLPNGGGSRAIAVGYPGGVNVAFDAHGCRLTYAWEGNFLDASPVWNNRGGAPAKLLGPTFLTAAPGNPWATTESRQPPDFATRADSFAYGAVVPDNQIYQGEMKVHFRGYGTDAAGVPTFRYDVDGLTVADTPAPAKAAVATGLSRRFVVTVAAGKTAWYLAGTAAGDPRLFGPSGSKLPVDLTDAEAEVPAVGAKVVLPQGGDRALLLHLSAGPAGTAWRFVKVGPRWHAVLRLPAGDRAEFTLTTWALPRDADALVPAVR